MHVAHAHVHPNVAPAPIAGSVLNSLAARVTALPVAAAEWLLQAFCGLSGHSLAYHFEPNHVSLHCLSCGHTTPGWTIRPRR